MVEYKLFIQKKYINSSSHYNTYGIIVFENGRHIRTVKDVSVNKEAVIDLIDTFNKYGLELCHLNQAIEDFLYTDAV